MLEELAHVIDYQDGWARVEVELKSACNHCKNSDNCGTATVAKAFSVKTQQFSIPSAKPCSRGDILKIGLAESVIIKSAALVYLMPLLGLFCAAAVGQLLGTVLSLNPNAFAMLFGAVGGVLGWMVAKRLAKKLERQAEPVIIQYLGQQLPQ
ncbi:SoxR reducing system RseC family protein [Shewanella intestini]|uniref:SoxR reducing system RseC family protein n=1 Tax=Shewanella intestini TaxID=2017544 RepID=A0ABS5HXZ8_9GAMM|nr:MULTISPECIES: SoxR reducing system RseC family protein [Shewanella]MBR9726647.1 SoxR reducing system RseC family protein [Shewanella intestini]MRG34787.1 Fis family transcriptional regulator [Shewanella sp. XMDDZSB0408]